MNAREDWLESRRKGLGGSDIGAILGLSPWRTPLDVYLDKTGQSLSEEENEAMYWGTRLESMVADEYARRTRQPVQRINKMLKKPGAEWMMANIDRAIIAPGSRVRVADDGGSLLGAAGIFECKTASAYKQGEWGRDGDDDAVPDAYAAQAFWYMAVTGQEWCDIAALIGGNKFLVKRIERDESTLNGIIERADEFWRRHVLAGLPPEPSNEADLKRLYPESVIGTTQEANAALFSTLGLLRDLRVERKRLEAEELAAELIIKTALGEAESLVMHGVTLATWKSTKPGSKTDWKGASSRLAAHVEKHLADEIIAMHTTITPAQRRFLLKGE